MKEEIKIYIIGVLIILLLLTKYRNLKKDFEELKTENSKLVKNVNNNIKDIQKRNKELEVNNEELKYYIQSLEKTQDNCLSSPVNSNVRRLLNEAGI